MSSNPLVSIITPVYKYDEYFNECYKSVAKQDYSSIEWIIISSEHEIYNINSFINITDKNHIHIRVICCEENNVGARRNIGIDAAKGKYILFMDADDFYYDCKAISILVESIIRYDTKIVGASCLITDKNKGLTYRDDLINKEIIETDYKSFQNESGFYRFIYKSDFLKKNCSFPLLKRFQDSLFLVKTVISAGKFYLIPEIVYVYRKGHKQIQWSIDMYRDHLIGVFNILALCAENKLNTLGSRMLKNIYITNKNRKPNSDDYKTLISDLKKEYLYKIYGYKFFLFLSPYRYIRAVLSFIF